MVQKKSSLQEMESFLSDLSFEKKTFTSLSEQFKIFQNASFLEKNSLQKTLFVSQQLLGLIEIEKDPCFLLFAVLDFIKKIDQHKIVEGYSFSTFELFLNHYSHLSFEDNRYIRGKIMGKWLPREEYQRSFPIGRGQLHFGTHFVTAHSSPDVDTTISSFWGWADAFAARVGTGLHIWNVPQGLPHLRKEISLLFEGVFGKPLVEYLLSTHVKLRLTARDLLSSDKTDCRLSDKSIAPTGDTCDMDTPAEEIGKQIGNRDFLTVTMAEGEEEIPVGCIQAATLKKRFLGSLSLRDFGDPMEVDIAPYLQIISVIDHHKSSFQTHIPATVIVADVQATCTLVAEIALMHQDRMSEKKSLLQKLSKPYFIHPKRLIIEYVHYLFGILDDTDLLMRVSLRDLECILSLLNRIKHLKRTALAKELSFDDIVLDEGFCQKAVMRLLQDKDMLSLYYEVYLGRENAMEEMIVASANLQPSSFFEDTKLFNGSCLAGQTKIWQKNFSTFANKAKKLRELWVTQAQACYEKNSLIDFHIHLIMTVKGVEEILHPENFVVSPHLDEMWIFIPPSKRGQKRIKEFLKQFLMCEKVKNAGKLLVEVCGKNPKNALNIFADIGVDPSSILESREEGFPLPLAIIRYPEGSINSRKAMISPFLPKPVHEKETSLFSFGK